MRKLELTQKELEEKAEYIKKEYKYIDKLSLIGGMWEFLRRSDDYKKHCKAFEDIAKSRKKVSSQDFSHIVSVLRQTFQLDIQLLDELPKDVSECYIIMKSTNNYFCLIPRCEKRFIDFGPELFFGFSGDEFYKINVDVPSFIELPSRERGSLCAGILQDLAILDADNTIYVGISKAAKYTDLKKILLPELGKHLTSLEKTQRRVRTDKWKFYLMCYDLYENDGYKYDVMSQILIEAYPKMMVTKILQGKRQKVEEESTNRFDARNIENYHKTARGLVDGKYADYLYESRQ